MEHTGKFFLTWTYGWEFAHDGDDWEAVCFSLEELRREYLRAYECNGPGDYCGRFHFCLQAYEYLGDGHFYPVPPEAYLEDGDPRDPAETSERREG